MIKHVLPYVVGSYGAAILILGFLALTSLLRYRAARRRLAAVEPRSRRSDGSDHGRQGVKS
ncbi:MAG: heme exporter protein CcmD [Acidiphilium sp.]|nr:heme exporter protein CcmD [Acidiphilium sp.]MDD4936111.1 heme exporter protein CcmD [Acidiphilium sp.]